MTKIWRFCDTSVPSSLPTGRHCRSSDTAKNPLGRNAAARQCAASDLSSARNHAASRCFAVSAGSAAMGRAPATRIAAINSFLFTTRPSCPAGITAASACRATRECSRYTLECLKAARALLSTSAGRFYISRRRYTLYRTGNNLRHLVRLPPAQNPRWILNEKLLDTTYPEFPFSHPRHDRLYTQRPPLKPFSPSCLSRASSAAQQRASSDSSA